jgi:transmembrane sensor
LNSGANLAAEASTWIARRDREDWSHADQAAFDAWLDRSVDHRVAYLRLANAWRKAERLKAMARPGLARKARLGWFPAPSAILWRVGATALAASLVVGLVALWSLRPTLVTYSTPLGIHKTFALVDGSKIVLNTNSIITASFTAHLRKLVLVQGEVYFEMKHNASRPVEVLVGDRRVTMLGTKFVVRKDSDRVTITVTEGRVRVDSEGASDRQAPAVLSADQILVASGQSTMIMEAPTQKVADLLSWRQSRLVFHQTTLADAANEFNRYNAEQLVVSDDVAATEIGGSFDPKNVETFASLVHAGFGFRVEAHGDRIIISR